MGDFSKGIDSQVIDLIFIGDIDKTYLINLIDKVEDMINRKVRYLIYQKTEIKNIDWDTFNPRTTFTLVQSIKQDKRQPIEH